MSKSSWDCSNCCLTNPSSRIQCLACFTPNPSQLKKIWECEKCDLFNKSSIYQCKRCNYIKPVRFNLQLLISGYIREVQDKLILFMNIPNEVTQIIRKSYPVFKYKFGAHDRELINVLNNGTTLKGKDVYDYSNCDGMIVYADLGFICFYYKYFLRIYTVHYVFVI